MLVTRCHAKHLQNYEYMNAARIMHVFFLKRSGVGKCDEVIKYSASMFSSFSQWFAEFMQ